MRAAVRAIGQRVFYGARRIHPGSIVPLYAYAVALLVASFSRAPRLRTNLLRRGLNFENCDRTASAVRSDRSAVPMALQERESVVPRGTTKSGAFPKIVQLPKRRATPSAWLLVGDKV